MQVVLYNGRKKMVEYYHKVKDGVPSKELREKLGIDDIILILLSLNTHLTLPTILRV